MKKPLVVIDTNIFISGLIIPRGHPYKVIRLWQDARFDVVISEQLLAEIDDVLQRKKIAARYHLTADSIKKITELLLQQGKMTSPSSGKLTVRDPKDQFILDTAFSSSADFLVTGDEDLLVLANGFSLKKLQIVTPKKFIDHISTV
ncbi:MAG: putative toxin-antitoxin system toxin component, PIN family [Candidatus Pacebacteria bacterium RIFCSPLOWO2_01_FULL_47_12]|nr:MAG: putative toxin-antitoxin system toxin component, PIN family [Candidatus Pacebacteria bacterium RIFCSPLOWO2_01_FULL_47_12]